MVALTSRNDCNLFSAVSAHPCLLVTFKVVPDQVAIVTNPMHATLVIPEQQRRHERDYQEKRAKLKYSARIKDCILL